MNHVLSNAEKQSLLIKTAVVLLRSAILIYLLFYSSEHIYAHIQDNPSI
jgi:hypothetical protein